MTAAKEYGLIRTTADAESIFDGRTIPAGMKGTVQSILSRDQYEIIET